MPAFVPLLPTAAAAPAPPHTPAISTHPCRQAHAHRAPRAEHASRRVARACKEPRVRVVQLSGPQETRNIAPPRELHELCVELRVYHYRAGHGRVRVAAELTRSRREAPVIVVINTEENRRPFPGLAKG